MRAIIVSSFALLVGCGGGASSYVHTDTTLGRVVVYRNGVAYFERYAQVDGDQLKLAVPADKVDDFLKSLAVVDARTGEPAPVAYPTSTPGSQTGTIDMNIHLQGAAPHQLKLSYVTESPSWKPSYRVVLGKSGKVDMQAWAIVDNTSGEDWNKVRLGVGSSSAMSFRFDLRSVRLVQRETLHAADLFALAPPIGEASYGGKDEKKGGELAYFSDESIANSETPSGGPAQNAAQPVEAAPAGKTHGGRARSTVVPNDVTKSIRGGATASTSPPAPPEVQAGMPQQAQIAQAARALAATKEPVVIEGYATAADGDKQAASLDRANRVREQLVRNGLDPNRVVAIGRGEQAGRNGGVRIVRDEEERKPKSVGTDQPAQAQPQATDPIGTSHFESSTAMSVPRGTSAMVSILHSDTDGEVVYLYDPDGVRGNAQFPFRAVRIKNPTESVLESGPVTVFGEGRFIGEGLCEPIPAHSVAFVPFALDRQVVVEKKSDERDEIARILTVQRGVFSTEVEHTKKQTLILHNRLPQKATVYLRHVVTPGYKLAKAPPGEERVGEAHLFRVELPAGGTTEVAIEEATPLFKTTDIRTPAGLDLVKVFVSSAAAEGPLKSSVAELLKLHGEMANLEQHIDTTREQMQEYRTRMDELHAQIVTLRLVKSGGPLMRDLEKKLSDMSDKVSKATIDLVALEEKLMVAKIHFQDGVANLSLEKKSDVEKTAATK